jgi:phospholipid-binding lipoprotein MlaA
VKLKYIILFFISFLVMSLSCYAQEVQDQTKTEIAKTVPTNTTKTVQTSTAETAQTKTTEPNDYINEDDLNDYINGDEDVDQAVLATQKDPYEKLNRTIFKFNETIDDAFIKPIAKTYNALMPRPLNTAIHNAFNNLSEMPTVVNDLLQFNFYQATSDGWRFAVNTTVGIGGALDVAEKIDLARHYEDVGLTLAKWGWADSNYFVIPFLGPSTIRDTICLVPYYYMTIFPYIHPWWPKRYLLLGLRYIDIRAHLLRFERVYEEIAIDPYVFMRSAYLQRRAYLMKENANGLNDPYTAEDTKRAAADDSSETYYLDDV